MSVCQRFRPGGGGGGGGQKNIYLAHLNTKRSVAI